MAPDPQDDDITLTGNLTLSEILSGTGSGGSMAPPPPDLRPNDGHCHFFSTRFFELLGQQLRTSGGVKADALCRHLGWDDPGSPEALAERWVAELDRHGVRRAMLIASLPGDETSVATAIARHPGRFVGAFMVNPMAPDALIRVKQALGSGLRVVCLFPAMHRYALAESKVTEVAAATAASPGTALFVHCGVLSVGVRKRLGLSSRFEMRFGQPLDVQRLAVDFPHLPIIVPHFGAGFFREALMLADACANVVLDTSSSNGWLRYLPGLTLTEVYRAALSIAGPHRLLFGTDSSFFPRGWVAPVYQTQQAVLDELGVDDATKAAIFFGTFDRLFPV